MFSFQNLLKSWDIFFFRPVPTEGVAVFRIFWCSLLFLTYLIDLTNIADFYGPHAIISHSTVASKFSYPHLNVFTLFELTYTNVYLFMGIYGLALISSIIGFHTRISLLTVLICLTSIHHRNIWLLSSSELLMRAITIFLVCAPAGKSLSLDALLTKLKYGSSPQRDWAPWAMRLIQIQVSVVYVWTVWQKLKGETWFDGTALYYATRLESMSNLSLPIIFDNLLFIKLSTWGTLILELALGILIWFKEFRRPLIVLGIGFHLMIEWTMTIPFFELTMIVLLLNFITPEEYRLKIHSLSVRFADWKNLAKEKQATKILS